METSYESFVMDAVPDETPYQILEWDNLDCADEPEAVLPVKVSSSSGNVLSDNHYHLKWESLDCDDKLEAFPPDEVGSNPGKVLSDNHDNQFSHNMVFPQHEYEEPDDLKQLAGITMCPTPSRMEQNTCSMDYNTGMLKSGHASNTNLKLKPAKMTVRYQKQKIPTYSNLGHSYAEDDTGIVFLNDSKCQETDSVQIPHTRTGHHMGQGNHLGPYGRMRCSKPLAVIPEVGEVQPMPLQEHYMPQDYLHSANSYPGAGLRNTGFPQHKQNNEYQGSQAPRAKDNRRQFVCNDESLPRQTKFASGRRKICPFYTPLSDVMATKYKRQGHTQRYASSCDCNWQNENLNFRTRTGFQNRNTNVHDSTLNAHCSKKLIAPEHQDHCDSAMVKITGNNSLLEYSDTYESLYCSPHVDISQTDKCCALTHNKIRKRQTNQHEYDKPLAENNFCHKDSALQNPSVGYVPQSQCFRHMDTSFMENSESENYQQDRYVDVEKRMKYKNGDEDRIVKMWSLKEGNSMDIDNRSISEMLHNTSSGMQTSSDCNVGMRLPFSVSENTVGISAGMGNTGMFDNEFNTDSVPMMENSVFQSNDHTYAVRPIIGEIKSTDQTIQESTSLDITDLNNLTGNVGNTVEANYFHNQSVGHGNTLYPKKPQKGRKQQQIRAVQETIQESTSLDITDLNNLTGNVGNTVEANYFHNQSVGHGNTLYPKKPQKGRKQQQIRAVAIHNSPKIAEKIIQVRLPETNRNVVNTVESNHFHKQSVEHGNILYRKIPQKRRKKEQLRAAAIRRSPRIAEKIIKGKSPETTEKSEIFPEKVQKGNAQKSVRKRMANFQASDNSLRIPHNCSIKGAENIVSTLCSEIEVADLHYFTENAMNNIEVKSVQNQSIEHALYPKLPQKGGKKRQLKGVAVRNSPRIAEKIIEVRSPKTSEKSETFPDKAQKGNAQNSVGKRMANFQASDNSLRIEHNGSIKGAENILSTLCSEIEIADLHYFTENAVNNIEVKSVQNQSIKHALYPKLPQKGGKKRQLKGVAVRRSPRIAEKIIKVRSPETSEKSETFPEKAQEGNIQKSEGKRRANFKASDNFSRIVQNSSIKGMGTINCEEKADICFSEVLQKRIVRGDSVRIAMKGIRRGSSSSEVAPKVLGNEIVKHSVSVLEQGKQTYMNGVTITRIAGKGTQGRKKRKTRIDILRKSSRIAQKILGEVQSVTGSSNADGEMKMTRSDSHSVKQQKRPMELHTLLTSDFNTLQEFETMQETDSLAESSELAKKLRSCPNSSTDYFPNIASTCVSASRNVTPSTQVVHDSHIECDKEPYPKQKLCLSISSPIILKQNSTKQEEENQFQYYPGHLLGQDQPEVPFSGSVKKGFDNHENRADDPLLPNNMEQKGHVLLDIRENSKQNANRIKKINSVSRKTAAKKVKPKTRWLNELKKLLGREPVFEELEDARTDCTNSNRLLCLRARKEWGTDNFEDLVKGSSLVLGSRKTGVTPTNKFEGIQKSPEAEIDREISRDPESKTRKTQSIEWERTAEIDATDPPEGTYSDSTEVYSPDLSLLGRASNDGSPKTRQPCQGQTVSLRKFDEGSDNNIVGSKTCLADLKEDPDKEERKKLKKTKKAMRSDNSEDTPDEEVCDMGAFVWGKLGKAIYWPGIIVNGDLMGKPSARPGKHWIFWFGDNLISELSRDGLLTWVQGQYFPYVSSFFIIVISHHKIKAFVESYSTCVSGTSKESYRIAKLEAIKECRVRAGLNGSDEQSLLQWAEEGFLIDGMSPGDAFKPGKGALLPTNVKRHLEKIKNLSFDCPEVWDTPVESPSRPLKNDYPGRDLISYLPGYSAIDPHTQTTILDSEDWHTNCGIVHNRKMFFFNNTESENEGQIPDVMSQNDNTVIITDSENSSVSVIDIESDDVSVPQKTFEKAKKNMKYNSGHGQFNDPRSNKYGKRFKLMSDLEQDRTRSQKYSRKKSCGHSKSTSDKRKTDRSKRKKHTPSKNWHKSHSRSSSKQLVESYKKSVTHFIRIQSSDSESSLYETNFTSFSNKPFDAFQFRKKSANTGTTRKRHHVVNISDSDNESIPKEKCSFKRRHKRKHDSRNKSSQKQVNKQKQGINVYTVDASAESLDENVIRTYDLRPNRYKSLSKQPQLAKVDVQKLMQTVDLQPTVRLEVLNIEEYRRKTRQAMSGNCTKREQIIADVKEGNQNIEEVCLRCGSKHIDSPHPLFKGGLCINCKKTIQEVMFCFDEEGKNAYCSVCGGGKTLALCDEDTCPRVFCTECIELYVGEVNTVLEQSPWMCYLCASPTNGANSGLLEKRDNWRQSVLAMFNQEGTSFKVDENKHALRVLSLFDGIGTGRLVLSNLKIQVEMYYASEIDQDSMLVSQVRQGEKVIQLGDVTAITRKKLEEISPIDLLIGGPPCNDLSGVNPARKGLEGGTGVLFFEYARILNELKVINKERPMFWLMENVASMAATARDTISRFVGCDPAIYDAKYFSPQRRKRLFWGNIPGLYCPLRMTSATQSDLQNVLMGPRTKKVNMVNCITTNHNSLHKQGKKPVQMGTTDDIMWVPEIEQLFGYPPHFTDVGNLTNTKRRSLLGRAWSVPVVQHIMNPLTQFFLLKEESQNSRTAEDQSQNHCPSL